MCLSIARKHQVLRPLLLTLSFWQILSLTQQPSYYHRYRYSSKFRTSAWRANRSTSYNAADNDEEAHLQGISVGIDLGTTNSAVAMMVPNEDGTT